MIINENLKKIIYPSLMVLAFVAVFGIGVWVGVTQVAYHVPQPEGVDFSLFWDAYNKLQNNFVNKDKIDNQKIVYGAIEGMTKSLGDPYTDFFEPRQAKMFSQDLAGSFEGIGVEVGLKKEILTVIAPLEGTPGQRAGLKAGDIIAKINGKDTSGMTTEEAVDLIRGKKGTVVKLTVFREGWQKTKEISITRGVIKIPSIKWELKNNDVAYVQIFQFDQPLSDDFRNVALQILQSPAKKIVLDLRNNPGGYLEIARDIAGWFMPSGQTVTIEDFGKGKDQQFYKTEGNGSLANMPIVILMNQGSASASEILAGALRDNRGVQLIGVKSFGKGSVQQVIDMRGGSSLKVTVAKWLTPKGASISEVGLEPDVKVEITEKDTEQNKDPQLAKALEIIKSVH